MNMTREQALQAIKAKMDYYESDKRLRAAIETLIPELAESEDERIRKEIIHYILYETKGTISEATEHTWVKWLEKQKEQKSAPISCSHENGISAEHSCSNDNSEYDKGYMDGKAFQLKQTEQYSIGKTFMGLIPCWVNAPSTSQPAHKYHGKNAVIMHENNGGFRCCFIDDEKATTVHLPEDTSFIEGWKKKPTECKATINGEPIPTENQSVDIPLAEWSEEDTEMYINVASSLRGYACELENEEHKEHIKKELDWLESRFKSLRHQPKVEWSEEDIKKIRSEEYTKGFNDAAFGGKLKEWSEEDEKILDGIINTLDRLGYAEFCKSSREEDIEEERIYYEEIQCLKKLKSLRPSWKPNDEDEVRLINTSISFLKDFADKGYENAVECIDWLKSKLNGNTCK